MPELEIDFHTFYILHPSQSFVIYIQLTIYQERIGIMENVRALTEEYADGSIEERRLIIVCPPESDVFDLG